MSRRVLIAGGGTGGHIFPGLAVAKELADRGIEVHWLGAQRGLEKGLVGDRGLPITLVEVEGIHARRPAAAARALGLLPRAVWTAIKLTLEFDPDVVLGVGGYASAAGVLAAGFLGIPWMLQEQNSVPGWTNRAVAPWADLVCCGFKDAVAHFPSMPAEWTGNPVRSQFFNVAAVAPAKVPRLLVLGGSQGSLFLNRSLPRALVTIREQGLEVEVVHQAGSRWTEVVRTAYADLHLEATVEAFLEEPWEALTNADLVVARAGALTVSELAASGRGALLVPFAAAAGNHQEFNARSLESAGGAVVLSEHLAGSRRLAEILVELLSDHTGLMAMGKATRAVALPDAARRIADRLLSLGGVG